MHTRSFRYHFPAGLVGCIRAHRPYLCRREYTLATELRAALVAAFPFPSRGMDESDKRRL